MKKTDVSKYFSELSKKRRNPVGGFKSPTVQAKALETRKKNKKDPHVPPEV